MLEDACAGEGAVCLFETIFAAVFGDDDGAGREDCGRGASEKRECGGVFGVEIVGRVEKDNVEAGIWCGIAQKCGDCTSMDSEAGGDAEAGEIGAERGERGVGFLDEGDVGGAAAEGLNADGSGAGVEIEKARAGDLRSLGSRRKYVEEGLAEAVAGGARGKAGRRGESAGTELASDDAHCSTGYARKLGRRVVLSPPAPQVPARCGLYTTSCKNDEFGIPVSVELPMVSECSG